MIHDWNGPTRSTGLVALQDYTAMAGSDDVRHFLTVARQLPITSFEVGPNDPGLLEELGPRAACRLDRVQGATQLRRYHVEPLLRLERPLDWRLLDPGRDLEGVTLVACEVPLLDPVQLARLLRAAASAGCRGVILSDEQGSIGPHGVGHLVRFARRLCQDLQLSLELTWAGGDRDGLALAQAIEAVEAGIDRIRGCALGVGGVPMDLLLVNLLMEGALRAGGQALRAYCDAAIDLFGVSLSANYPVFGRDAFRVTSESRAAELTEAERLGPDLVDQVPALPARWLGAEQRVEVGPRSGPSNARHWLESRRLESSPERVQAIVGAAQQASHVLSDLHLYDLVIGF